ncbi:MAG: single-stranded DNA-binding protein [Propionibacteriaceae bacterium]|jgi:spoIIIJ-associated protein|nr:single-stranded DNA-binding protein [Propionibacteriaceae bacterium]
MSDEATTAPAETSTKKNDLDTIEQEGEIAADYLEELLDIADIDGDIDTYVEAGRAHVAIHANDDQLVGADGEVLEALQDLSRLAILTKTGHRSRIMIDVAGHREKRRQEIQELAQAAVADVQNSGEATPLPAMNPFERKIVHDVVAKAGLMSESEGEEPKRHVIIKPAVED